MDDTIARLRAISRSTLRAFCAGLYCLKHLWADLPLAPCFETSWSNWSMKLLKSKVFSASFSASSQSVSHRILRSLLSISPYRGSDQTVWVEGFDISIFFTSTQWTWLVSCAIWRTERVHHTGILADLGQNATPVTELFIELTRHWPLLTNHSIDNQEDFRLAQQGLWHHATRSMSFRRFADDRLYRSHSHCGWLSLAPNLGERFLLAGLCTKWEDRTLICWPRVFNRVSFVAANDR